MAIRVQSNYFFNGNGFLDSRQGKASTLQDLIDWDFEKDVIPEGFEVYVDGNWYTYDSSHYSEDTGKFKPRQASSKPEEKENIIYEGKIVGEV